MFTKSCQRICIFFYLEGKNTNKGNKSGFKGDKVTKHVYLNQWETNYNDIRLWNLRDVALLDFENILSILRFVVILQKISLKYNELKDFLST